MMNEYYDLTCRFCKDPLSRAHVCFLLQELTQPSDHGDNPVSRHPMPGTQQEQPTFQERESFGNFLLQELTQPRHIPATIVRPAMTVGDLKKPPVKRMRGWPKGREMAVIGLPKWRRRYGPQKFRVRPPMEREKVYTMSVPPLNILVLGDSHVFWLDSFIRSDSLAERFGELQIEGRACHVEYLGIRGATVATFLTPNMRAQIHSTQTRLWFVLAAIW